MAEALVTAGDRGSAVGYFRDAIAADPASERAYSGLADVYRARGALGEARAIYEAGLGQVPNSPRLRLGLARVMLDQGAERDALRALRASGAGPGSRDLELLRMHADLARRLGAWSEALALYRAIVALYPEEADDAPRFEAALRLLAAPMDPVAAGRACRGSEVRRALARCP
jgi:tetratricopeptide (TPR) repeat protein